MSIDPFEDYGKQTNCETRDPITETVTPEGVVTISVHTQEKTGYVFPSLFLFHTQSDKNEFYALLSYPSSVFPKCQIPL